MTAIDLAHDRRSAPPGRFRRGMGRAHAVLATLVVLAVFVQVYLIGAYVFGAGQGALDAHRSVGFTTHGLEIAVLITALLAWLPRVDLAVSLALAIIGTVQIALADSTRWVGGLHPLFALLVLGCAGVLVRRGRERLRRPRPDPDPRT